jgi:hypothetical protein
MAAALQHRRSAIRPELLFRIPGYMNFAHGQLCSPRCSGDFHGESSLNKRGICAIVIRHYGERRYSIDYSRDQ